ncbi:MAG: lipocalin family protein [Methanomassiliicoccales archaeon]
MPEAKTVEFVDPKRYMGTWFEIARFPQRFENGLVGVTATYTLLPTGQVEVVNGGYKDNLDGKFKSIKGKAWVADTKTNAKLKVRFFWPFTADYWILELGKDYEYAVVGDASGRNLWILSRTPQMEAGLYDELVKRMQGKGFDTSKLEKVPQKQV